MPFPSRRSGGPCPLLLQKGAVDLSRAASVTRAAPWWSWCRRSSLASLTEQDGGARVADSTPLARPVKRPACRAVRRAPALPRVRSSFSVGGVSKREAE
jgi:hypothetical protein